MAAIGLGDFKLMPPSISSFNSFDAGGGLETVPPLGHQFSALADCLPRAYLCLLFSSPMVRIVKSDMGLVTCSSSLGSCCLKYLRRHRAYLFSYLNSFALLMPVANVPFEKPIELALGLEI